MKAPTILAAVLLVGSASALLVLVSPTSGAPAPACPAPCGVLLTPTAGTANEVDVAVDPTDPQRVVIVAKDYSLGPSDDCGQTRVWVGVWRSVDGGATWSRSLFPGYPGDVPATAATGYPCMSDPVAGFAPDGTLFFVGLAVGYPRDSTLPIPIPQNGYTDARDAALVLGVSDDAGATWRTSRMVETKSPASADKEWLAVGPDGALAVGWHSVPAVTGILSRSPDGGRTWSHDTHPASALLGYLLAPFYDVDGGLHVATTEFCPAPHVGVPLTLPIQTCMVAWREGPAGAWIPFQIGVVRAGVDPTSGDYRAIPAPIPAVDHSDGPSRGRLALAWTNASSTLPFRYHPAVAVSDDDGASWRHITPTLPRTRHQTISRVAISPLDGTIGMLYYEDTGTATTSGLVTARFIASSDGVVSAQCNAALTTSRTRCGPSGGPSAFDGGATWSAPIDLSPAFDPLPMLNQFGVVFLGDYNGLAVGTDGVFHASWADGRHGRSDAYAARIVV